MYQEPKCVKNKNQQKNYVPKTSMYAGYKHFQLSPSLLEKYDVKISGTT